MLEAGEDARFIARRLVILASEDIGMADPISLSWPRPPPGPSIVGLPEAGLNLAQAVVYLATAPKSNRVAMGIWNGRPAVPRRPERPGADGLARRPLPGGKGLGHGEGYETLTTTHGGGCLSSTSPTRWPAAPSTIPRPTATRKRSADAWTQLHGTRDG